MNEINLKQFAAGFLLFAFCFQMVAFNVKAQLSKSETAPKDETADFAPQSKIAPDLQEKTNELMNGVRNDELQKVIIQLKSETGFNEMSGNNSSESDQKQLFAREVSSNKAKAGILMTDLMATGGKIKKSYNNLGLVSAELPLSKIRELLENENVAYISPDRQINASGHLNTTTGVEAVRAQTSQMNATQATAAQQTDLRRGLRGLCVPGS